MRIAEIGKSYLKKEYGGKIQSAIEAGDHLTWTESNIHRAFNYFGENKDDIKIFQRHIEWNRKFCVFYDLEKHCTI